MPQPSRCRSQRNAANPSPERLPMVQGPLPFLHSPSYRTLQRILWPQNRKKPITTDFYFGGNACLMLIQLCRGWRPGGYRDLVALSPQFRKLSYVSPAYHSVPLDRRQEEEVCLSLAKMIPSLAVCSVNICGAYFKLVLKL